MLNMIKTWFVGIVLTIPLFAAPSVQAGYDECVRACIAEGYDEDSCRSACK